MFPNTTREIIRDTYVKNDSTAIGD